MKVLSEQRSDEYQHTYDEVRDILISILALGFAFTVAFFGEGNRYEFALQLSFLPYFLVTTIIVAISVVAKEMAQKATARALESHVRYELWSPGVVLALVTSIWGVVFAAVNGTKISTEYAERYARWRITLTPRHLGIIASIGPLMNIALAMAFFMLSPVIPTILGQDMMQVAAQINAYLALFAMVPFNPIDGAKVLRWSAAIWFFNILMSIAVIALTFGWI